MPYDNETEQIGYFTMRIYKTLFALIAIATITIIMTQDAHAVARIDKGDVKNAQSTIDLLAPHKALYDINLVATRSGSQIINIKGQMFYEWKPTCEAWVTDHRFTLSYEYADSPGMKISSDFSTYETFDGENFNFSARRKRDNTLYQELRGQANLADKGGKAVFTMPDELNFELNKGALFPMSHTVEMIEKAKSKEKFFQATVFDGSDDEGPVEINTFIGASTNAMKMIEGGDEIEMSLINTPAWKVRMAVFPKMDPRAESDYEMSMVFHENGVISDMLVEYDDFSVSQKLVALEKVVVGDLSCGKKKDIKN